MGNSSTPDAPLVSIIVPAYNVEKYVRSTLDSTLRQGLPKEFVETIVVDDGSTDGTATILAEYSANNSNIRTIYQENSGGPGGPRNVGIDAAAGKYLFFLDADDELTANAIRDLVKVAEAEGSDVILGKGEGINGRVVPGPVFRATKLDADLIEDNVYRTLSPWKLFRKELIDAKHIRFNEGLRIGEDQPFVACALLNAKKISVLADRPYARLRARGDGTNVTAEARSAKDFVELANAVVAVIIAESRPGRIRDGMLVRPLKRTIRPIFNTRFLDMPTVEQDTAVRAISALMFPHYNEDIASHLTGLERTKVGLAVEGSVDKLRSVIAWEKSNHGQLLTVGDSGIRYNFPPDLLEALGEERIYPPPVTLEARLSDFSVHGALVNIAVEARIPGLTTGAPQSCIRLSSRGTGQVIDVVDDSSDSAGPTNGGKQMISCAIDVLSLSGGIWDISVVQRYPGAEVVKRLGSKRSRLIEGKQKYLYDGARAHGLAYFTRGGGFLSLDIGFHVRAHRLPSAQIVGLMQEPDGDASIVVSVSSSSEARVILVIDTAGNTRGDGVREINAQRLSDGIYGARIGRRQMVDQSHIRAKVVNDAGEVVAGLAESLAIPDDRVVRSPKASHGEGSVLLVNRPGVRSRRQSLRDRLVRRRSRPN